MIDAWWCRVFWKPQGSNDASKNDTEVTQLSISGLKENVPYQLVIKSGSHFGTSMLTDPVLFTLSDKYVISSSTSQGKISRMITITVGGFATKKSPRTPCKMYGKFHRF